MLPPERYVGLGEGAPKPRQGKRPDVVGVFGILADHLEVAKCAFIVPMSF